MNQKVSVKTVVTHDLLHANINFCTKLCVHRRDFPAAWMNLGILLANTNRFEESEQAYKTAISYRRKYPDCFYNLGNLVSVEGTVPLLTFT